MLWVQAVYASACHGASTAGIDLRDETLVVEREPNRFVESAIEFCRALDRFSIEHVFVAGDVAILAGGARPPKMSTSSSNRSATRRLPNSPRRQNVNRNHSLALTRS